MFRFNHANDRDMLVRDMIGVLAGHRLVAESWHAAGRRTFPLRRESGTFHDMLSLFHGIHMRYNDNLSASIKASGNPAGRVLGYSNNGAYPSI